MVRWILLLVLIGVVGIYVTGQYLDHHPTGYVNSEAVPP